MNLKVLAMVMLSAVTLAVKFFTSFVYSGDDPTVFFAIRSFPSFQNRTISTQPVEGLENYVLVASGENSLIGSGLYFALVDWGWTIAAGFLLAVTIRWVLALFGHTKAI